MQESFHDSEKAALEEERASTIDETLGNSSDSFDYHGEAPQPKWLLHEMKGAPAPRRRWFTLSWTAPAVVFLFTTAFWGALFGLWQSGVIRGMNLRTNGNIMSTSTSAVPYDLSHNRNIFSNAHYIDCGRSTEEARRRGCVYDMLANHYVHELCYDEISTQSYMDEGKSWMGFRDKNKTIPLSSIEEMGDYDVYWTSQRDHIVHCGEMWKRQYRAFSQNWRYIDAVTANEAHTYHCADYLVEMTDWAVIAGRDWRNEPNTVEVGFAGCHDRAIPKESA